MRLRTVMLDTVELRTGHDGGRRENAARWFAGHLAGGRVAAFAAESESGELVAAALGELHDRPPSPSSPAGVEGHLSNVVTLAEHRKHGYARACVKAVLAWFRDETAVLWVRLFAGAALYCSLGFERARFPVMSVRINR